MVIISHFKLCCRTEEGVLIQLPPHDSLFLKIGEDERSRHEINVRNGVRYGDLTDDKVLEAIVREIAAVIGNGAVPNIILKYAEGQFDDGSKRDDCIPGDPYFPILTNRLKRAIGNVLAKQNSGRESFRAQLLQVGVPEDKVDTVMFATEKYSLESHVIHTTETLSGLVMKCKIGYESKYPGAIAYVKLTSRKELLAREARYLTDAWMLESIVEGERVFLLRPSNPCLVDRIDLDSYPVAGLITYGVENAGIVPAHDLAAYTNLRQQAYVALLNDSQIKKFMKKMHLSPEQVMRDPLTEDMFNRALSHILMQHYVNDPVYTTLVPFVPTTERLDDRLQDGSNQEATQEIIKMYPVLKKIQPKLQSYLRLPATTVIHRDARPENIWLTLEGTHALGDPSFAEAGIPEMDIAQAEVHNVRICSELYSFFSWFLAPRFGREYDRSPKIVNRLTQKTTELAFAHTIKMASWYIAQGRNPDRYVNLTKIYASQIMFD